MSELEGGTGMAYDVGNWVELTRDVDGGRGRQGQRGKITSTGFMGGLDLRLEDGTVLTGVSTDAVRQSAAGSSGGDLGCLMVALMLLAGVAGLGWAVVELGGWVL